MTGLNYSNSALSHKIELINEVYRSKKLTFECKHVMAFFALQPELIECKRDFLITQLYRIIADVIGMTEDEARKGVNDFMRLEPTMTNHWTRAGDWERNQKEIV